ncbi:MULTISPECIES: ABC transporter substrate-binding protein [Bacillaceae]|uniref:ABC transporter substrate-binding protein n=1 Tax=Bacillaceae TaxID=186817 RepID=UPI001E592F4D|nr:MULTISPECIES: ABC transporter substrate-binding protein [Bacillaceae]MCE4049793.1 ABC transporter substrate-binding protein [Bacillus sp. Au-Bac7]MDL0435364.1 ABC transporter substrate-binding protein [Niallia sp. SS-2023]UPO87557.1 ABC transporter substrate-binding protein [Niallia sp. Man26]
MVRKGKLLLIALLGLMMLLAGCASKDSGGGTEEGLKKIVIAEPVHLIGYLPLYLAIQEGYFEEEGLEVEVITATGGAHVTSLVSGDAWGNIAGPDSNQMANPGSSDPIQGVVNVVNRANVYLMGSSDEPIDSTNEAELASYLEGKTIAAGRYGGSPNLLTRWLLLELGLDPDKDVKLEEPADASAVVSLVESGQADIANGGEPQITEGINKGVWNEPFYSFPSLGDYPYSVISVKKSTIENEPEVVESFVKAMLKGLKTVDEDHDLAMEALKKEFPTTSDESLKASLDRAYADQLWSKDGFISEEALAKPMDVVEKTGVYKEGYKYEELIDMQFVEKLSK